MKVPPVVRRTLIGVTGGTVLLVGVGMLVLPGPAVLVIPAGLAILGTEFVWARRWLRKARARLSSLRDPRATASPPADQR